MNEMNIIIYNKYIINIYYIIKSLLYNSILNYYIINRLCNILNYYIINRLCNILNYYIINRLCNILNYYIINRLCNILNYYIITVTKLLYYLIS
jgi:hypothetical protein